MEKEMNTMQWKERLVLAIERLKEVPGEYQGAAGLREYFEEAAAFLLPQLEAAVSRENVADKMAMAAEQSTDDMAREIETKGKSYRTNRSKESYLRPAWACYRLGEPMGKLLSAVYAELHTLTESPYGSPLWNGVIRAELFLEIYSTFLYEQEENKACPSVEEIRKILYWYAFDYVDEAVEACVDALQKHRISLRWPGLLQELWLCGSSLIFEKTKVEKEEANAETIKFCGREVPLTVEKSYKERIELQDNGTSKVMHLSGKSGQQEGTSAWWMALHNEDIALILDKAYIARRQEALQTALLHQMEGSGDKILILERVSALENAFLSQDQNNHQETKDIIQGTGNKKDRKILLSREQRHLWTQYMRNALELLKEHYK